MKRALFWAKCLFFSPSIIFHCIFDIENHHCTFVIREFSVELFFPALYLFNMHEWGKKYMHKRYLGSVPRIHSRDQFEAHVMQGKSYDGGKAGSLRIMPASLPLQPLVVLLDFFKFITVDWKSNGDVRKQRPPGTCTASFRFNTTICFSMPGNDYNSA